MNTSLLLTIFALFAAALFVTGCTTTSRAQTAANAPGTNADGYACPLTGDILPCERCCPLNGEESNATQTRQLAATSSDDQGYQCPITGETLPCENCCPLNTDNPTARAEP